MDLQILNAQSQNLRQLSLHVAVVWLTSQFILVGNKQKNKQFVVIIGTELTLK